MNHVKCNTKARVQLFINLLLHQYNEGLTSLRDVNLIIKNQYSIITAWISLKDCVVDCLGDHSVHPRCGENDKKKISKLHLELSAVSPARARARARFRLCKNSAEINEGKMGAQYFACDPIGHCRVRSVIDSNGNGTKNEPCHGGGRSDWIA